MNKTVTITSRNHKYQNTYSGEVYQSDFNTEYEGERNIAQRIIKDWYFDNGCKKDIANRKRGKMYA